MFHVYVYCCTNSIYMNNVIVSLTLNNVNKSRCVRVCVYVCVYLRLIYQYLQPRIV